MRALALLALLLLLGWLASTLVVVVDETEHVVITQFGKPVAVHSEAGARLKLPAPIQRLTRFDKRTLFNALPEIELLTADKKNVMVASYIAWRVVDPLQYLAALRVREFAEGRLTALVQSELGSTLGDHRFSELVPGNDEGSGLPELERRVLSVCNEVSTQDFGIEIASLGITRLNFPNQNQTSVFARMRAERERIARGFRSEGAAEAQKVRAEADRERAEMLASAEAEAARLRGDGEAKAARIYADAYSGHEEFYTFLRTLETYEKTLKDNTTLVLPADAPFLELLLSRGPGADRDGR